MKAFTVEERVFTAVPDYCLGIVIADGIDNRGEQPATALLPFSSASAAAGWRCTHLAVFTQSESRFNLGDYGLSSSVLE